MLAPLDIASLRGLDEAEAASRLKTEGLNELPASRRNSLLFTIWEVVREPMLLMLVACGAIYLLIGSREEALMLLGFVFVVMGITLYQQRKTEHALEALRDLSSPRALVIRGGRERRIAGREVARGDCMVIHEGDRVAADAVLLHAVNLTLDESLLTGESVPVRKRARSEAAEDGKADARPGGDDQPHIYSGTLVVQGHGIAEVTATGPHTELGRIGHALGKLEAENTPLQGEISRLVRTFAFVGITICVLIIIVYGLTRHDWLNGVLAGLTLAMATIPEEFPVVLTIFLALGTWRLSRSRVLTRRMPAVEALGSATVLCVDKTGTLTQNLMQVARLDVDGRTLDVTHAKLGDLPETFHPLVEYGILASQRDPFDPMDKAIAAVGARFLRSTEHLHGEWSLIHEYPLSRDLLALSHVWQSPDGADYVVAAKGAPEAIFDLCHLPETERAAISVRVQNLAGQGLRVLGVAHAKFRRSGNLPTAQHDFEFRFLGLIGLADPIRPAVPAAVRECREAGIRVVMITGDYPGTALNIAAQIGLESNAAAITGPELDGMDDDELVRRCAACSIFARVVPEQKLRIVRAFKARGDVVAMTGDGVNDAPALKAAHIGVAMGGRGTDVARESASLVLLDDDFASIVNAVRMGRRIFDNIKKAVSYILAVHVPIAGMSLVPVLFGWPLALLPVHILFLELIIDPACSTVFEAEPEEEGVMQRPPRPPQAPLFNRATVAFSLLQGAIVFAIVLFVFRHGLAAPEHGEEEARAMAFTTLVIANLGLILTNLSSSRGILAIFRTRNVSLMWVLGGTTICLALALYTPFLQKLLKFSVLHPDDILICISASVASVAWFEAIKFIKRIWTVRALRNPAQRAT